jgi:hypothetical protein
MGGFSGGATDAHRFELVADFEVVVSTIPEGKNVHPEFAYTAQVAWPRPLTGFQHPLVGSVAISRKSRLESFLKLAFKRKSQEPDWRRRAEPRHEGVKRGLEADSRG